MSSSTKLPHSPDRTLMNRNKPHYRIKDYTLEKRKKKNKLCSYIPKKKQASFC